MGGKCTLSLTDDRCFRATQIVMLDIRDKDGSRCLQVGKWSDLETNVDIKLPGSKVDPGESTKEAVDRFLLEEFQPLCDALILQGTSFQIKETPSKSYGIDSKYYCTQFHYSYVANDERN